MKLMKCAAIIIIVAGVVSLSCAAARASDYQGDESQQSVFQKLSDLITGSYKVEGKPLNKVGVFNVFADEARKTGPSSEKIESAWNPTEPPRGGAK